DALHPERTRLESGEELHGHLSGLARRGADFDAPDDFYERQERDFAEVVARRKVFRLRLKPRSPGRGQSCGCDSRQSALPDASRRRRSARITNAKDGVGTFALSRDGK